MASKVDKLRCHKVKKTRNKADTEVCAKNISLLSNNDIKIILSKYSSLSLEDKILVRQFSTSLQKKHFNRFCNLSKFFKEAYDSEKPVRNSRANAIAKVAEKNTSKDEKVTTTTNNKTEQKIVTKKPIINNNPVAPNLKQENTIAPFHTNIISTVNSNNNNIVNINPLYSTIFPTIHQKVLSQCISSFLLPQAIMNNTISNLTAVLNLTQNINSIYEPVNNQTNTIVESQKEPVKNLPSKFQSVNTNKKIVPQASDKTIENSEKPDPVTVKQNGTNTSSKSKKKKKKPKSVGKDSKNQKENHIKNNETINTNKEGVTVKNTINDQSVQKLINTTKTEHVQNPIKTIKMESKKPDSVTIIQNGTNISSKSKKKKKKKPKSGGEDSKIQQENHIKNNETIKNNEKGVTVENTVKDESVQKCINVITTEPVQNPIKTIKMESVVNPINAIKTEPGGNPIKTIKMESKKPNENPINTVKTEPKSPSNNTDIKKLEVVQDLESFSMEHMKKIESFAQRNAIKLNLSSNSKRKISETYTKIKQNTESKITNLNSIKPFFGDGEINTNHKMVKETNIIKTSYGNSDGRLIEYPADDHLKNDSKMIKSKVIKNSPDIEKCRVHSNDNRNNDSSKSDFLKECNFLKSIISKNSNTTENNSKKEEKLQVTITKKSKKKRKKNKSKNKGSEMLKLIKLDEELTAIAEEKNKIVAPEEKTIISSDEIVTIENIVDVEIHKKKLQKREVKVVNRVLRNDSPNDQIIKSISEKPFTEECNKITNDMVLETKHDVKCKIDKTMDNEDLMVLLKYFYKLDGLEQRRLIEFLKDLELTEPERVADLRKHVRTSPPDDEDKNVLENPQLDIDKAPTELDDRPESRNSDLSNIDVILEDIDSILNDEDVEESSSNKEDSVEPAPKRLKTDLKANELKKMNDAKCTTTITSGKTIPVQFKNSQNYTYNNNQNLNNYWNSTPIVQYNNVFQQSINYINQVQNFGYNYQNQYFQNNFQQASYQLNTTQLFMQNQNLQNEQNYFQDFQNVCYNYNNSIEQYQQNYSNYQNGGYFQ